MKSKKTVVHLIALLSFIVLTAIDQISKIIIIDKIPVTGDISVIDKVLKIVYVKNTGAAWGLFKNGTLVLSIFSSLVLCVIIFIYFRLNWDIKKQRSLMVLCVFIASGAVGNLIDRILRQFVVDFIYIELIDFPVFNIADCYITVSMFVLAALLIFYYKEEDLETIWQKRS
ncbi:MAG: signal peptidase II [Lachnospiraceae bacterium]|nr:signal peptidase II [Lachnospiraceae bacterium]